MKFFNSFFILILLFLSIFGIELSAAEDFIGYWKFDAGAGTVAADSSAHGNNGTLFGGAQWVTGYSSSAIKFDGIDDYVKITKNSIFDVSGDFSIDMWVNPSSWSAGENLLYNGLFRIYHRGEWAGDHVYFLLKINSTDYRGESSWAGWAGVYTTNELKTGSWYHLTCVKSGNNMAIYLNGEKKEKLAVLSGYPLDHSSFTDLFIGGNGTFFNGNLDEVRIWNRALTETEVDSLYAYPPEFTPIGNQTVSERSCLRFVISGKKNALTYSAANLPAGASFTPVPAGDLFDPYKSEYKFTWTPSSDQVGSHNVSFSVSKGTAAAVTENITITVKKSSLLHGPQPGFICRGDGEWVEKAKREYGADANPTGNPLGGGAGYNNTVSFGNAAFVVNTKSGLKSSLAGAASGQIVYIADDAEIDMTGEQNIVIPAGVTLASGRGKNNSLGALVYSDKIDTYPLFTTGGNNVRLTGLRLRGPDPYRRTEQMQWLGACVPIRYYDIPNSEGIRNNYSYITVDNCELYAWSHAAVAIYSGSNNYVHHNFIHHNQRSGLGYGVCIWGGASALVEANMFDWNRHSIAGSRGYPVNSYEARYNLVLANANGHYFDMHGGNDTADPGLPAGGYIKIHHNTFLAGDQRAVCIRGVPTEGSFIYNNWATYDTSIMAANVIFAQSLSSLPGHTPYENMSVHDNWFGALPSPNINAVPSMTTSGNKTVIAGATLSFTLTADDPDADNLIFSALNLPAGATFDPLTKTFNWTPTPAQIGTYIVRFEVSDGGLSDYYDITITVTAPPANVSEVIAFPNPCYLHSDGFVRISNIPLSETNIEVSLFTITGERIRTLKEPNEIAIESTKKTAKWDGKNESGQKVASGIYLYLIKGRTGKKMEKIAVIW